jgi:hypothetical protein
MQKMKKLRSKPSLKLALLLGSVLLAGCAGAGNFVLLDENGSGIQGAGGPGAANVGVTLFTSADAADVDPTSGETAGLDSLDVGLVPDQPEPLGPDDFPAGTNPLTGQPLCEPEAVNWGVVGISISQFPPQATRPATGLSWAAWVTEWWIGDGDTRLYVLYYGCYPEVDVDNVLGDQQGGNQTEPGEDEYLISDLVWYDSNSNAMQDPGEPGVPGVQAELILNGAVLATTTSDGAGKYAFIIEPEFGVSYQVRFTLPASLEQAFHFVGKNQGGDELDSDADPATGLTDGFKLPDDVNLLATVDAGLNYSIRIAGVRSGRIVYEVVRKFFEGCTIIAGADPEVAAQMQICAQALTNDAGDIGAAGLDVTRLKDIAAESLGLYGPPNLTGNLFDPAPPESCAPAQSLNMFYNINNQTFWEYDAANAAYIRHQNTYLAPELQEVSTESLTGEPLAFENVIVFFTEHESLNSAGTLIDVHMESTLGRAKLLRDGLVCDIYWSTINGDYEQETGRARPIRFVYADGTPFPLKPGQLFIHMVHTNADFYEPDPGSGEWRARWYLP